LFAADIRGLEVLVIPSLLRLVLAFADRVRVGEIGRLAWIGEQELMARPIRLLDVHHHEVGVWKARDRAQPDVGLVLHKLADELHVDGLELDVRERRERRRRRVDPLDDPEVRLRLPEADVVVDVVDIGEHLRDGSGVVPRQECG
jgi:hypothetical protein